MVFIELRDRVASSCAVRSTPKWRWASLWARNVHEVIREAIFNSRAHQPPCGFLIDRACQSCSLQNGAVSSVISTRLWGPSLSNQPRVNCQRLTPPREPICLSTDMRIVPSSSCFEGKPAIMPWSYTPSSSSVLWSHSSHTELNQQNQNTRAFTSDLSSMSRQSMIHSGVWLVIVVVIKT